MRNTHPESFFLFFEGCRSGHSDILIVLERSLAEEVGVSSIPTSPARPPVTPFRLFQAINAFHLTEAIRSAIELDIFTAIGAGHTTAEAVASQCGIAQR